jgi:hypothetical protein
MVTRGVMSAQIVVLQNGQQLIANVCNYGSELLTLHKPCLIFMADVTNNVDPEQKDKTSLDVSLFPWIPLSKDQGIDIPSDSVLALVDPVDALLEMYEPKSVENIA